MPNVTLPNGRTHYVNPFSMLCDACERRENSDFIVERCRYECADCQNDWESEHAAQEDFAHQQAAE